MILRVAAVAAAALIAAWALVRFVYLPNHCNAEVTAIDVATVAAKETASDYMRLVRARRNLERLAALRDACPTEVRVPMLRGENEEIVGRPEDAVRSYTEALAVDRRPEIYVALAKVQIQIGRIDEGVESYAAAARFSPAIAAEIVDPEIQRRMKERLRVQP